MLRHFINTLSFLTIIPLPRSWLAEDDYRAESSMFPLVGLVIGLILYICGSIFYAFFPSFLAATLSIAVLVKLTGAIHLDGLADTADGFFSARPREKIMEIMKDSRIGVMGAVALILVLLVDISALSSTGVNFCLVLLLAPITARTGIIIIPHLIPCVRPDGMGNRFCGKATLTTCIIWLVLVLALNLMLGGRLMLGAAIAVIAVNTLICLLARKKIGGYTGDVIGAACEVGQMWFFLICAIK